MKLRSPRDPEFWLPILASLAVLVPLALYGYSWVTELAARLERLALTHPEAALAEAVYWLRGATWVFCALLVLFGLLLFRSCQLGLREGRLPPSGWWSYGALQAITGDRARRMARVGQWLAGLLLVVSPGLAVAVEYLVRLLLAGDFPA